MNSGDTITTISAVEALLSTKTTLMDTLSEAIDAASSEVNFSLLCGTTRFSVARWVQQSVTASLKQLPLKPDSVDGGLSARSFGILLQALEDLEDFPTLYGLLVSFISQTEHTCTLDLVATAGNQYFDTFDAMDVAKDLFMSLLSRYKQLHTHSPLDKSLLVSLIDIGQRFPDQLEVTRHLRKELLLCEPKSAAAACSPVSDGMADSVQIADATFAEEMGLLLSSGTSMDHQVLCKVFDAITKRLEHTWKLVGFDTQIYWELLERLRPFDSEAFDTLAMDWFRRSLLLKTRPSTLSIVLLLVCSKLLTLDQITDQAMLMLQANVESANSHGHDLLLEVFGLLVGRDLKEIELIAAAHPSSLPGNNVSEVTPQRLYRFFDQRSISIRKKPLALVSIFGEVFRLIPHLDSASRNAILRILTMSASRAAIQTALSNVWPDHSGMDDLLATNPAASSRILGSWLGFLPEPEESEGSPSPSPNRHEESMREILTNVDDLNAELCMLQMKVLFLEMTDATRADDVDRAVEVLISESAPRYHLQRDFWTCCITNLPPELASKVCDTWD